MNLLKPHITLLTICQVRLIGFILFSNSRCRAMRDWDRNANLSCFPALFYPEMYVLHRGYKGFYEEQPVYCEPPEYKRMLDDPEQLRVYKSKCKAEVVRLKSKSIPTIKLRRRSVSVRKFDFWWRRHGDGYFYWEGSQSIDCFVKDYLYERQQRLYEMTLVSTITYVPYGCQVPFTLICP